MTESLNTLFLRLTKAFPDHSATQLYQAAAALAYREARGETLIGISLLQRKLILITDQGVYWPDEEEALPDPPELAVLLDLRLPETQDWMLTEYKLIKAEDEDDEEPIGCTVNLRHNGVLQGMVKMEFDGEVTHQLTPEQFEKLDQHARQYRFSLDEDINAGWRFNAEDILFQGIRRIEYAQMAVEGITARENEKHAYIEFFDWEELKQERSRQQPLAVSDRQPTESFQDWMQGNASRPPIESDPWVHQYLLQKGFTEIFVKNVGWVSIVPDRQIWSAPRKLDGK